MSLESPQPSPEQPPLAPHDPPMPPPQDGRLTPLRSEGRFAMMNPKHNVAVAIALQTHVLRTCPVHHQLFVDADADPASAFALAVDLVKQHIPYVDEFRDDTHALTDLLIETIAAAPETCPMCGSSPSPSATAYTERERRS